MKARQSDLVLTTVRLEARRDRTFGVPIRHPKRQLPDLDTMVNTTVHLPTPKEVHQTSEAPERIRKIATLAQVSIMLAIVSSLPIIALLELELPSALIFGRKRQRAICQDLVYTFPSLVTLASRSKELPIWDRSTSPS